MPFVASHWDFSKNSANSKQNDEVSVNVTRSHLATVFHCQAVKFSTNPLNDDVTTCWFCIDCILLQSTKINNNTAATSSSSGFVLNSTACPFPTGISQVDGVGKLCKVTLNSGLPSQEMEEPRCVTWFKVCLIGIGLAMLAAVLVIMTDVAYVWWQASKIIDR